MAAPAPAADDGGYFDRTAPLVVPGAGGGRAVTSAALQLQTSSDSSPCVPDSLALDELATSAKVATKLPLTLTSVN